MESDFEAFRRERNYRRRQTTTTDRPDGNRAVWEAIEEKEAEEMRDQLINAEVDDFFSDATRLAANIVRKVSEHHDQEISDQLRAELEEFLLESIRHATNMINRLPRDTNIAEKIVEPNLRNLAPQVIDEFRAEGTAQLDDKHLGQDLFDDLDDDEEGEGVALDAASASGSTEDDADLIGERRVRISDDELELEYGSTGNGVSADDFALQGAATLSLPDDEDDDQDADAEPSATSTAPEAVEPPASEEDQLPLAALYAGDGAASVEALPPPSAPPERKPQRRPATTGPDPVREALLLLVKQGVMTKDQARAAYRAQTRSG